MPLYVVGLARHDPAHAALRRRRNGVPGCWSPAFGALIILSPASSARSRSSSSASAIARSCATSPAIPGTAARWNGRRPRRRRRSISPCCPMSSGEDAYWAIKRARRAAAARGASRTTSRSRCRATRRPASSARSSPRSWASRMIWHIWWMVIVGLRRRVRDLRRVRLARPRRIRDPGRGGRAHRPRQPSRERRGSSSPLREACA